MAENMIKFLRGNVASLPKTATEGALYFTKDEGVYLGLADGSYHRYGDFITVANVDALPAGGAHETCMYYCVAENILAKWGGTEKGWVQINKQKTLAELGGVAKSVYEAKITALEKADGDNTTAINGVKTLVGSIPESATATTVVGYVDEKVAAANSDVTALAGRVATAEGEIDTLQAAIAKGGSVTLAIADAKKAGTDAQSALSAYKTTNDAAVKANTDAISAINNETTGILAQAKTYADGKDAAIAAAKKAGDDAQADVDALEIKVGEVETAYKAKDSELAASIKTISDDYLKAADKTELQGNIDKKVDKTTYEAKVSALETADTTLQGNIDAEKTARETADNAQVARIAELEGKITGLSGAMHFKGIEAEVPADVSDYTEGDVIIVGEKEYVFNGTSFAEFGDVSAEGDRIAALETTVGNESSGLVKSVANNASAIAAEKSRAEGAESTLSGRIDTLEAIDHNVYALKTDVASDKTELQNSIKGVSDRVKTIEDKNISDGANKVEKSTTNGNIKIDGVETVVYTHPAKHIISDVTGLQDALDAKATPSDITAEINKLDVTDTAEAHKFVTAVSETDGKIAVSRSALVAADIPELATSKITGLDTTLSGIDSDITALENGKADKATTLAGYGITDAYTKAQTYDKTEVDALLTWGEF